MAKFSVQRDYMVGWYTLKRDDAINGLKSYLAKRNGVKNICVSSCIPAQLEGDKGFEMHVSYQEDLDETFNFPKDLDKVIFLDIDSDIVPYNVKRIAAETQAGIVITNPSLKDSFYDDGDLFPQKLARLIENANENGVHIVGITPSVSWIKNDDFSFSNMMGYSICRYLDTHPSIKNFIVINREDMQLFSPNVFINDISFRDEEKAKSMLNGQSLIKKR